MAALDYRYAVDEHGRLEVPMRKVPVAQPYAWPGGYPIGYVCDDGEYLCAGCVNDPRNPVHIGGSPDGWRIEGYAVLEGSAAEYDGPVYCAHCWAVLVPDDDETEGE